MAQYPQREADNCRDYLRTGRCKYGDSCKYHHPPNVLNGGGVKSPLNPGDPPFPIRPSEPPCQYFIKHGTCKFGQACKFNHPPLSPKQRSSSADGVSMPPGATETLLPQRPMEPDCIYFLRNGRCKYGASCKYHHPTTTNYNASAKKKLKDRSKSAGSILDLGGSAVTLSDGANAIPIHIISSANNSSIGQAHIILKEGTFALMMNPSNTPFQQNNGTAPQFYLQQSSSAPSSAIFTQSPVFSSTAPSSYDLMDSSNNNNNNNMPGRVSSSQAAILMNASPASVSHYRHNNQMTPLTSDQMGSRRDEYPSFYEEGSPVRNNIQMAQNSPSLNISTNWMTDSNDRIWEGHRSSTSHDANIKNEPRDDNQRNWDRYRAREPYFSTEDNNNNRAWDDGLSNMTTSLLTMLDTSDERPPSNDAPMEPQRLNFPSRSNTTQYQPQRGTLLNSGSEQKWPSLLQSSPSRLGDRGMYSP